MKIEQVTNFPEAQFEVTIQSVKNTVHLVHLHENYYQELTNGIIKPKELIQRSFDFLLEREPNTAILSEFELQKINDYFPDFEGAIKNSIGS